MNTESKLSCKIVKGEYVAKNASAMLWEFIRHLLMRLFRFIIYLFIYCGTFFITLWIFQNCIIKIPEDIFSNLEPPISLGAIFATFGSAILTVYSLDCNEQLRKFHETLATLQTDLLKTAPWKRWQFLKRYHIVKYSHRYYCYSLTNPSIILQNNKRSLKLFIPYDKEDFYELPICFSYFRILHFQKKYLTGLQNFEQMNQSELLLLNCLSYLYRNIIRYKKGKFFIIIGCFFIFNSILFSLFYYAIDRIIVLLH